MMGAQTSQLQMDKIMSYMQVGKDEGAQVLIGGAGAVRWGAGGGYYIQPTLFRGTTRCAFSARKFSARCWP